MTIIGVSNPGSFNPNFIVTVTQDELAIIRSETANCRDFMVGEEIKVGAHWQRVTLIEAAQDRLDSAAKSIRAIADLMGTIDVVVSPQPTNQPTNPQPQQA